MTVETLGKKVADFCLLNQAGQEVSLARFTGRWVVIYFYPKASTPGCTVQACGMRDAWSSFESLNAVVLGVSPDPVARLHKFHRAQQLNFDLLSDTDHKLTERFGVWALKKFMGKEFMGVVRTSFIIDPDGNLAATLRQFKTSDHHEYVIDKLNQLIQARQA